MNEKIKDIIQDCNLNFLMGSGLSCPYLMTLGSIETLLTDLDNKVALSNDIKKVIQASLYKTYFDGAIAKNLNIPRAAPEALPVLNDYSNFLKIINSILLRRKSTILSKTANLFTTNLDIFMEKALEDIGLEYNDGFNGRFKPSFSLSNFKKSYFKKSLHYDNTFEIPVFNLLKLHGSLTWQLAENGRIIFSTDLSQVKSIQDKLISPDRVVEVSNNSTIESLIKNANGIAADASMNTFLAEYDKLLIVNPTKEKFKHTLLNQTYYELLRIYANELEKENTVLFVMGFSFRDEHIREITLRVSNSNPTLMIYIIAYDFASAADIRTKLSTDSIKNRNVEIIAPPRKAGPEPGTDTDEFVYDLGMINRRILGKPFEKEWAAEAASAATDQAPS